MLTADQHRQLAQRLFDAEQNRQPLTPLSDEFPQLQSGDSYAIQALLLDCHGAAVEGFKLGFTSAAMREQMGVDEPNLGALLTGTRADQQVAFGGFIHPRVEPEIALQTGRSLEGRELSITQIVEATEAIFPALEIVDSRFCDYRFRSVDNIADNSSAAGYALGRGVPAGSIAAPESLRCKLFRNGEVVGQGVGADAMGGPFQALLWLVKKLSTMGKELPAGSIVLTGGADPCHGCRSGRSISGGV